MMDFLKWLTMCIAILGTIYLINDHETRLIEMEQRVEDLNGRVLHYNRPIANCIEMRDLLRNRPYPPAHGVHSYANPVPVCEQST